MAAPRNIVAVRWSNGMVDRADSWDELLENIRLDQFSEFDPVEFRDVLAKRAWRWSRTRIDRDAEPAVFFMELAHAKLIEIVDVNDKRKGN